MVGFSVYEGKLETSIEKGQEKEEEEGSVSMSERERERERKGKYKSSEREKGKETEGEMAKKVTTPDVGSRAKLCM